MNRKYNSTNVAPANRRAFRWYGICTITACLAGPAMTGAAPLDPPQTTAGSGELAEVVVTAQRVESDLQHTPVAVTAFSQAALEQQNVTNIENLSGVVPSVQITTRSSGGTSLGVVTIRGMGINANPPASPAVGLYIDEVYYPSAFGNLLGVFDVNGIEVLRGPQGTLFGRNTIGGALLYTSKQPELGSIGGFAELTGGNQGRADVQGAVNLPLGDKVAVRLSGALTNEAGYVHDELNDLERGSEHDRQARLQIRAELTDRFEINFKLEDLEQRSNGPATIVTGFNYHSLFGAPFAPNGAAAVISTGWYEDAGFDSPAVFDARFRVAQLTATYKLSDDVTFKSISAYSVSNSYLTIDQDYTPLPIVGASHGLVRDTLFTQELRLSGNSFGNRLHWGGGVYFYGEQDNDCCGESHIFGGTENPFGNFVINTQSYAIYGQATYDLTSQLAVVAGVRYTDEEDKVNDSGIPPVLPFYSQKVSFNNTSPLVGLNYQINKDALLYIKASQGFRAGGFSPTVNTGNEYNPETAKTYEAGARIELLDHRLRINPTVYYTLWDAVQFNAVGFCTCYPGALPFIKNAGNAKVRGAELEVQAAVTDALLIAGSMSVIDSRYTSIAPFLAQTAALYPDTPLAFAPKTSFFLGPQYSLPLPDQAKLIGSLSYTWQSKERSATDNTDNIEISPYGLLSGRLTYQAASDRWSVALWGRNLTDKRYAIGGTNYGAGGVFPEAAVDVGRPREYGATARYNF